MRLSCFLLFLWIEFVVFYSFLIRLDDTLMLIQFHFDVIPLVLIVNFVPHVN